jgi:UDP-glucose 4-epimerase
MKKFFITGGAGFIGSHLVDCLINLGEVTVYDNFSSGKKEFIQHHLDRPNFRLIEDDLLNFKSLAEAVGGHDSIIHLAANPEARRGIENTRLDLEQETLVTYNVLESMRKSEIGQIVFASSGTVYGDSGEIPVKEDYGPLLPISLYGAGKLACEGLISGFCGTFGMQAWIFRFANVVGSRATHGVMYDFVHKLLKNSEELEILGDGKQSKPYLHVSDCVEGILFALQHAADQINLFNLGVDGHTSVTTIAELVAQKMELEKVKFRFTGGQRGWPGDVSQVRYNVDKMKKLGWTPKLDSTSAANLAVGEIVEEIVGQEVACRE